MAQISKIEWTDATWNPTRGCSRVSPGCVNCYAERLALRWKDSGYKGLVTITNGHPAWTGVVRAMGGETREAPLHWKKPRRIFVNSMSDLFHEALPDDAIDRVFAVMALCPQHTFQVLTKRPERMLQYALRRKAAMTEQRSNECSSLHAAFPDTLLNVRLGVSVEDQDTANKRIPLLLQTPATTRFVSYEPALAPVDFTRLFGTGKTDVGGGGEIHTFLDALSGKYTAAWKDGPGIPVILAGPAVKVDQIIVGGESGPGARPLSLRWIRSVLGQCKAAGVACFVKQLGSRPGEPSCADPECTHPDCDPDWLELRDRKGGDMAEWPEDLRVREFPPSKVAA